MSTIERQPKPYTLNDYFNSNCQKEPWYSGCGHTEAYGRESRLQLFSEQWVSRLGAEKSVAILSLSARLARRGDRESSRNGRLARPKRSSTSYRLVGISGRRSRLRHGKNLYLQ